MGECCSEFVEPVSPLEGSSIAGLGMGATSYDSSYDIVVIFKYGKEFLLRSSNFLHKKGPSMLAHTKFPCFVMIASQWVRAPLHGV